MKAKRSIFIVAAAVIGLSCLESCGCSSDYDNHSYEERAKICEECGKEYEMSETYYGKLYGKDSYHDHSATVSHCAKCSFEIRDSYEREFYRKQRESIFGKTY